MIHATRRIAVLLVLIVAVAAGCSRGGSATPKVGGMRSRANNWGRYGVVHTASTGVKRIVKGTWKCTASIDKGNKTATTDCTGKSDTGQTVSMHSVSSFSELSKYKVRALPGNITIKVDGVTKATLTCAGPLCPKGGVSS